MSPWDAGGQEDVGWTQEEEMVRNNNQDTCKQTKRFEGFEENKYRSWRPSFCFSMQIALASYLIGLLNLCFIICNIKSFSPAVVCCFI
jgi:hypothetical protein